MINSIFLNFNKDINNILIFTEKIIMKIKFILLLIFLFISLNIHSKNSRAEIVQKLFKSIENWIGTNYKLGGNNKEGVDCSGLIAQVYKEVFNIDLPKSVTEQRKLGLVVTSKLQPGDILFFKINDKISHVGIYLFNNKFIHAASSGPAIGVTKNSLNENYYKTRYAFAKRIITLPSYKNEKKIIPIDENSIIIGKVLFRGKILEISESFISKNPIYLQVKTDNLTDYKILFIKEVIGKTNKNENISDKIMVKQSNIENNLHKILLNKGSYIIRLYNSNEEVLFEKIIKVN